MTRAACTPLGVALVWSADGVDIARDVATSGRAVPTRLTEAGDRRRLAAGAAVRQLEAAMTSRFDEEHVARLQQDLVECVAALDSYNG